MKKRLSTPWQTMNRSLKPLISWAIALCCLGLLFSCSQERDTREGTSHPPVVYRLKWLYNASVAGDIWAQEAGIFRSYGLNVEIKEGGPEQDAIKDIELHRAWFGVASADQVIRALAKGADVVVLAQIFQVNPLQWIYRADKIQVKSPKDLKGLTIGITYGGNDEAIFSALMRKYHLSQDQLNLYAVHYDFNPFWKGEVDLWPVYRNTQGIVLSQKMKKNGWIPGFFNPNEFGIRFVANSLITSRWVLQRHPEVVKKFTQAILEAWSQAMAPENEERICQAILQRAPDTPVAILKRQLQVTREMVAPQGIRIGHIDRMAWEQTSEIMLKQGLIEHRVELTEVLIPPK